MPFDPASLLDVSHLVTFIGGATVGATGQYLADRFTDQRRKQEESVALKERFAEIRKSMPELLREMAQDLRNNTTTSIRQFAVLPSQSTIFNNDRTIFIYYASEHPHLENQVNLLIDNGFVDNVTVTNAPMFKMHEQFVQLLREHP